MEKSIKPFLRWPGGKRWIIPIIQRILNGWDLKNYFEPFLGGGSVFFNICPQNATLSDINEDLINTYIQVSERPLELIVNLKNLAVNKATFLMMREKEAKCSIERATKFLYLNRTAFSGIYRLNKKGQFNVPYGGGQRTPEPLWRDNLILNASKALKNVTLCSNDFEKVLEKAGRGDFIYCDPTYITSHANNGFKRYNERNFSWKDQERLAKVCQKLAKKGALVMVSNAYHNEIAMLYPCAKIYTLERKSLLCPLKLKRKIVKEYLIVCYP